MPEPTAGSAGALSAGAAAAPFGTGPTYAPAPAWVGAPATDASGAIPPGVSRALGLIVLMLLAGYFDIRVFRRRYG